MLREDHVSEGGSITRNVKIATKKVGQLINKRESTELLDLLLATYLPNKLTCRVLKRIPIDLVKVY